MVAHCVEHYPQVQQTLWSQICWLHPTSYILLRAWGCLPASLCLRGQAGVRSEPFSLSLLGGRCVGTDFFFKDVQAISILLVHAAWGFCQFWGTSPEAPVPQSLSQVCFARAHCLTLTSSVSVPGRGQSCSQPQIVDCLLISLAFPLNLSCRIAGLQLH